MTICWGELTFATSTTSPAAASAHTCSTAARSIPMTAAIAPVPTGTASCMNSPRRRTMRTASRKASAPATTRAEYSPRLWPAAMAGVSPRSAATAAAATLTVSTAGWVFAVSASSSSGPSKAKRARSKPSASLASSKTAFAEGEASQKARPMPTACEPWPGKRNAIIDEGTRTRPGESADGVGPGARPVARAGRVAISVTGSSCVKRAALPADQCGAPGEAAAEGGEQHEAPTLEPSGRRRLFHRHVDRRGTAVAVPVDVDEDLVHRQAHALDGGFDDPQIRLVGNEEVQVGGGEPVAPEDRLGALHEHPHGDLEDVVALHLRIVHPRVDRLARRRVTRAAAGHVEQLPVLAVGVEVGIDDPGVALAGLQHGGARGVGQQDAGAPVGEVGDPGQALGADAEHPAVLPGLDELGADGEAVDGSRARGQHVDRAGAPAAETMLQDVGGGGEEHVGRGRAHDDEVDVLGHEVRVLERLLRRPEREIGGGLALVDDVALADARPLHDPLVVGVHHLLEVGVGQDALRGVRPHADDLRPPHSRPPSRPPRATSASSAALMCSFTPAFAHSLATRTAFLIAFTGAAPWQMIAGPSPPRSGAPPISV